MSSSDEEDGRPHNGHLGTTWEIVIVTVFVVLIVVIIGTVLFQIRRKQRLRREEQETLDAEAGAMTRGKRTPSQAVESRRSDKDASLSVPKPPASSRRHSTAPSSSSSHPDHPSKKPPRYYWDHR